MIGRRLVVRAKDVVFVKGVVEAHDGLAHVFAPPKGRGGSGGGGGELIIAAPKDRLRELDELVQDLANELDGVVSEVPPDALEPDDGRGF
jgi:hypothetical protein